MIESLQACILNTFEHAQQFPCDPAKTWYDSRNRQQTRILYQISFLAYFCLIHLSNFFVVQSKFWIEVLDRTNTIAIHYLGNPSSSLIYWPVSKPHNTHTYHHHANRHNSCCCRQHAGWNQRSRALYATSNTTSKYWRRSYSRFWFWHYRILQCHIRLHFHSICRILHWCEWVRNRWTNSWAPNWSTRQHWPK